MPNVFIPDVKVTLVEEICGTCGIIFAWPTTFKAERMKDQRNWYCPNGHSWHFSGPSEADKLRDELAREKHRTEQARADADYQRTRVAMKDRQLSARQGQITKIRNRIKNGVCPCCNRSFTNLHRHMTSQHPAWSPESDAGIAATQETDQHD